MKIAITGGSGFVGRALTRHLHHDHHVVWLSSHHAALPDKLTAEFKTVDVKLVDYHDVDSLSTAVSGCDAVIHLVGILHATTQASFDEVHHQLPKRIVEATANAGIKNYLHMSALGADEAGPSDYLKSKYQGEQAAFALAKQHGIRMLSFRPSIIFGPEDNFFNQFAKLLRFSPVFPIVCPNARFQPVSVDDVARAFAWGLDNKIDGKTYELVGREVITMQAVIEKVCAFYGWKRLLMPLPDSVSRWQGKLFSHIPNAPFTYDNYLSLQKPSISDRWDWDEMGITPEPIRLSKLY
ncbi:MAG: epimerase [Gammaproteobacteria bacterium]|nr:MAG: epimerase [Gammaproteobacteria bacterium]